MQILYKEINNMLKITLTTGSQNKKEMLVHIHYSTVSNKKTINVIRV